MHTHEHSHDDRHSHHEHDHGHDHQYDLHESKTKWVVIISAITMVAEIAYGFISNSMALTADGWHMSSHVLALGLTWVAYRVIKHWKKKAGAKGNQTKVLSLSGYTSAVILGIVGILILVESAERLFSLQTIMYGDAMLMACVGLAVNGISALILKHDHGHSDHNIRAAYLHVLADTVTSLLAISALFFGQMFNLSWLDAAAGIIGSLVVLNWAVSLLMNSAKDLLEYK